MKTFKSALKAYTSNLTALYKLCCEITDMGFFRIAVRIASLFCFLLCTTISNAAPVPKVDVCGTLVVTGKNWRGERLERVLNVNGEKLSVTDFYARYCQSSDAKQTETCNKALTIARIDMAEVSRKMPYGLCPEQR